MNGLPSINTQNKNGLEIDGEQEGTVGVRQSIFISFLRKGAGQMGEDAVSMRGISKRFGSVTAVDRTDFHIKRGEIHVLLGENGAGKTTLMKMLYGMIQPDEGEIFMNGSLARIRSPKDAISYGINMVHQHFMLAGYLTVAENLSLIHIWYTGRVPSVLSVGQSGIKLVEGGFLCLLQRK